MTTRPGRSHADGTVGDARVHAPPGWMEPMLALIERIDRRRLGIRPIRRDGISGLVFTNHRGPDVLLADGVIVRRGDRIGAIGAVAALPISRLLTDAIGVAFVQHPLAWAPSAPGIVLWLGVVILLSALGSLAPAWRAARIRVREVLAYE